MGRVLFMRGDFSGSERGPRFFCRAPCVHSENEDEIKETQIFRVLLDDIAVMYN